MNTATFVRRLDGWNGDARLYKLSKPIPVGWEPDTRPTTRFVVISAVVVSAGAEVMTFAANAAGTVLSWADGPGSHRGDLDHSAAIAQAGWLEA